MFRCQQPIVLVKSTVGQIVRQADLNLLGLFVYCDSDDWHNADIVTYRYAEIQSAVVFYVPYLPVVSGIVGWLIWGASPIPAIALQVLLLFGEYRVGGGFVGICKGSYFSDSVFSTQMPDFINRRNEDFVDNSFQLGGKDCLQFLTCECDRNELVVDIFAKGTIIVVAEIAVIHKVGEDPVGDEREDIPLSFENAPFDGLFLGTVLGICTKIYVRFLFHFDFYHFVLRYRVGLDKLYNIQKGKARGRFCVL